MGFIRVELYRVIDKWLSRFTAGLLLVHRGFWLGLLDRPDLQKSTDTYYNTETIWRSHSYNLSGFSLWEAWAMSRYFGDCRSILVAAAGGGREVVALAKRDFRVDAFECNEELVRFGQRLFTAENVECKLILASPDEVPPGLGAYDGIIVGWGAYMLIGGRDRRVQFLKQLRLHTHSDSPILLSFFIRDPQSPYHNYRFKVALIIRRIRRSAEAVELGDDLAPNFVHRFTQAEIADELAEAGFKLSYYSEQPYGHAIGHAV